MVSLQVSLNLKSSLKIYPQETMAAGENRFAPKLNEEEVIELLYAIRGRMKKATKYGMKIFQGKNLLKLFIDNLSI